jgi:hypothetical protein
MSLYIITARLGQGGATTLPELANAILFLLLNFACGSNYGPAIVLWE